MEENIKELIAVLVKESTESEWLEFKKDNAEAKMIGQDISALANGAALVQRNQAYMIWGVDDKTHAITGTNFSPYSKFQGNQEIFSWLRGMLSDNAEFRFEETVIGDKRVVVLIVAAAVQYPVAFQKEPYVRIGSYTKRLATESSVQAQLWDALRSENFELTAALKNLTESEVEEKLNVVAYFQRLNQKAPNSEKERLKYLETEQIIRKQDNHLYSITNFGAILLANSLKDFPSIRRKEIRVVQYKGTGRREILRNKSYEQGYAVCISDLFNYLDALLPSQEPINSKTGVRQIIRAFPLTAVRELLVNALIHQDLTSEGDCVLCEIFDNRLEITNPGTLLVEKDRIIDLPPKSRNVLLASVMRHMHLCEELGTGWDRVVELCESAQLPSPEIIQYPGRGTKVILYSHIDYSELTREQKLWACYLHACVLQMDNKSVTNATLRERFGLDAKSASSISRLLAEAVKQNLLKLRDETVGSKAKRYVPYWA